MAEAMDIPSNMILGTDVGHRFGVSSYMQKHEIHADGLDVYTAKVVLAGVRGGSTESHVRMEIASEQIPGLDQPYQTCMIGDINTGHLDDVSNLTALAGLLLHVHVFCQERGIRHLSAKNEMRAFTRLVMGLAGFKPCTCRLPGQVNNGSRLCLPFTDIQANEEDLEGLRLLDSSGPSCLDAFVLPSDTQTTAQNTQSASQVIDHAQALHELETHQSEPMSAAKTEYINSHSALGPAPFLSRKTATERTPSAESQSIRHVDMGNIERGSHLFQPKQLPAVRVLSEDHDTTQQNNIKVPDQAQASNLELALMAKENGPHRRLDSNEMEIVRSHSSTADASQRVITDKSDPNLATLPKNPFVHEAQVWLDRNIPSTNSVKTQSQDLGEKSSMPGRKENCSDSLRIGKCEFLQTGNEYLQKHPNNATTRPSSPHRANAGFDAADPHRTAGIVGQKEYCTYYFRTGKCDFMQKGCKYKHDYPQDQAARRKPFHAPYLHLQEPQTSGVLGKKEYCTFFLRTGTCDYMQKGCKFKHEYPEDAEMRRALRLPKIPLWGRMERHVQASGIDELAIGDRLTADKKWCPNQISDPAGRKRSYQSPDSEDMAIKGYASGRSGDGRRLRRKKSLENIHRHVHPSKDREQRATLLNSTSSLSAGHITGQHSDEMSESNPIEALDIREVSKGEHIAHNSTFDGHRLQAPGNRRKGNFAKGTMASGRGLHTGRARGDGR